MIYIYTEVIRPLPARAHQIGVLQLDDAHPLSEPVVHVPAHVPGVDLLFPSRGWIGPLMLAVRYTGLPNLLAGDGSSVSTPPEVITVQETLQGFETTDVYEPPLLAEAGPYAELTQGEFGDWPDYPVGLWL
jgi:hypothetical protein